MPEREQLLNLENEINWTEWSPETAEENEETEEISETSEATQESTEESSTDWQSQIEALKRELQQLDWAKNIQNLAEQNPKLAAEALRKVADLYEKHGTTEEAETTAPTEFDPEKWLQALESFLQRPPVDPQWMSDDQKWFYQLIYNIVQGLKQSYEINKQQLAQMSEEQFINEATNRAEQEFSQLQKQLGAAWSDKLEEMILAEIERVAEEEDRLIYPLEAYGRLLAQGKISPPLHRPRSFTLPRSSGSAPAMRSKEEIQSPADAVRAAFRDLGIEI